MDSDDFTRRELLQDVHGTEKFIIVCREMRKIADLQTAGTGLVKIPGSRASEEGSGWFKCDVQSRPSRQPLPRRAAFLDRDRKFLQL